MMSYDICLFVCLTYFTLVWLRKNEKQKLLSLSSQLEYHLGYPEEPSLRMYSLAWNLIYKPLYNSYS